MSLTAKSQSPLRQLLGIAIPMVASQASDTVMMFVDRLFVSRLGPEYLAATMSGGLTQFMLSSFFIGTVGYVTAIVAQYHGAQRPDRCASATFQAIVVALCSYPILLALSPLGRGLFMIAGHTPRQIELESLYFNTLIFGSVTFVLRNAFVGFFVGLGRTRTVMFANLVAMTVNVPATYLLVFGGFGIPPLGLVGAAVGTIIGSLSALAILVVAYLSRSNRTTYGTHRAYRVDGDLIRRLVRYGAPAGVEAVLSVMAFNIFIQFMHSYGSEVAAAVTVTFNWDVVAFIPMLGMGAATTSLVGRSIGAKAPERAWKTVKMAIATAWTYSGIMMLLFLFAAPALVAVFLSPEAGSSAESVRLATTLLRFAAFYTMADSAQIVFSGALRGAGDTAWVMRVAVGLHWAFATAAIVMIRVLALPPLVVWIVFISFVMGLSGMMFLRFRSGKWQRISLIETTGANSE